MTAPHYYASTSGIVVDRFIKYGVYPFAYGLGIKIFGNHERGTKWAQAMCLAVASGITTTFLGLESQMIDDSGRKAVATAMGVDQDKLQFSDYGHSSNIIIKKAHDDLMRLQKYRYGTDLLFLLPTVVETIYYRTTGKEFAPTRNIVASVDDRPSLKEERGGITKSRDYNPGFYSGLEKALQGHVGLAMSAYAGKAAYWVFETFNVPKTAYYDVVKLRESLEATGKDITANDLKSIYQRTRTDRKLPMVSLASRKENDALRELFTHMANEYNKHDGKFGIAEIVYLIGEGKINIHASDQKTFSQAAVEQSHREIEKVLTLGLDGIREQNRQRHAQAGDIPVTEQRTFTERFSNRAVNTIQSIIDTARSHPKRPEEYISERDPTNLLGLNGINH